MTHDRVAPTIGRELALTAKAVRAWADDAFVRNGSSLTTWILLQHAAVEGHPPSQTELADRLSIGGATMVRHLDRLEADGLVRRDRDPHDRRVTRVSLTPAGQLRWQELAAVAAEVDGELRSLITEREADTFLSVLDRLRAHTGGLPMVPPSSYPTSSPTPTPAGTEPG